MCIVRAFGSDFSEAFYEAASELSSSQFFVGIALSISKIGTYGFVGPKHDDPHMQLAGVLIVTTLSSSLAMYNESVEDENVLRTFLLTFGVHCFIAYEAFVAGMAWFEAFSHSRAWFLVAFFFGPPLLVTFWAWAIKVGYNLRARTTGKLRRGMNPGHLSSIRLLAVVNIWCLVSVMVMWNSRFPFGPSCGMTGGPYGELSFGQVLPLVMLVASVKPVLRMLRIEVLEKLVST
jgi:hypothetical protein